MRPKNIHAVATKSSIASLWAMAETYGSVQIILPSQAACINVRNKLYAHRSGLRKTAAALVGIEASHLDSFKFQYDQIRDDTEQSGKWIFTISYDVIVEFDLILPDAMAEEDLAAFQFDTALEYDDVISEMHEPIIE